MYAGQIVELAPALDLLRRPLHPYTKALMNSVPQIKGGPQRLQAIPGTVPAPGNYPPGCRFFPRCPTAQPQCEKTMPELVEVEPNRWVRSLYVKS
jgi:oligopeptide/dipeptide ABC transporter ATP-binding protein